ncbi:MULTISPECIES: hypothetical protein [Streptomyces]|uniref:hypothetical protein n=1 Tax=Streptomyces TaxID=1883 RepID=UPI002256E479|nr:MULTISPECIES: hypothetical protein [Streptomyces]MCX5277774.1 hypothetical protein [Streptomyces virginiae]MCX5583119.1 hypothetical protein [Streptomyces erythrochromogenes]
MPDKHHRGLVRRRVGVAYDQAEPGGSPSGRSARRRGEETAGGPDQHHRRGELGKITSEENRLEERLAELRAREHAASRAR